MTSVKKGEEKKSLWSIAYKCEIQDFESGGAEEEPNVCVGVYSCSCCETSNLQVKQPTDVFINNFIIWQCLYLSLELLTSCKNLLTALTTITSYSLWATKQPFSIDVVTFSATLITSTTVAPLAVLYKLLLLMFVVNFHMTALNCIQSFLKIRR